MAYTLPDGNYFTVTGRGYLSSRLSGRSYGALHAVLWCLTGWGLEPGIVRQKSSAVFFATSSYAQNVPEEVLAQWKAPAETWLIGAPVETMVSEHSE